MESQKKKQTFPELSSNETKLLQTVTKGSVLEVQLLLGESDVNVDCLDDCGMTPLQHAAFRGKTDIAEMLIHRGANINSDFHENGYTALMFAALSGNTEVTRLMLQNGAKKDRSNSVGRNAAQMAAFVGQHQCVAVINNYYDQADLGCYTVPRGQEKEAKLPPMLLPALLKLLNMANLHPVKVSLHALQHPELINESYKVCKVLDMICSKAMKARDTDDVMALKAHYFATVIRKAKEAKSLDVWIKMLLKGRDRDGHPEFQDQVIRQALQEFPFVDSTLLQNMVRQLSTTKIGDDPSSLNILNQAVNGQKFGFDEIEDCATCGELNSKKKCTACKMAHYCSPNCQKLHWFTHKKFCKSLAVEYERIEKTKEENKKLEEQIEQQKEEKDKQTNGEAPEKTAETTGTEENNEHGCKEAGDTGTKTNNDKESKEAGDTGTKTNNDKESKEAGDTGTKSNNDKESKEAETTGNVEKSKHDPDVKTCTEVS